MEVFMQESVKELHKLLEFYDEARDVTIADIIIYAKYRGKGFGKIGLQLLCETAKKNNVKILCDDIAIDNPAIGLFVNNGFVEDYRTEDYIMLKKILQG